MASTKVVLVAAVAAVAVAGVGAFLTEIGPWYRSLVQPRWKPPDWLFGPAWTVIFLLIAWAGVRAWEDAPDVASQRCVLALFTLNGVLNILWSLFYFRMHRPDWALYEVVPLWLSILLLIVAFAGWSPTASWLLAPYLVWVTFAAVLNRATVRLNGPFAGR